MQKKDNSRSLSPQEIGQLFDQILALHLDRLIGTSHGIDGLPLNLLTITVMILVTEQATDEIENFSSAAPRFTPRTLVREMKEIGIVVADGAESVFKDMVEIGYLHEDEQGHISAKKPTISMTRLLDKVFPKIPGMNLVAYFVQMIDETTSNRKDRNEALAQFDQTLLLHGVDIRSGSADDSSADQADTEKAEEEPGQTKAPAKTVFTSAKSAPASTPRRPVRKSALKRASALSRPKPSSLVSRKATVVPVEKETSAEPEVKQVGFGAQPDEHEQDSLAPEPGEKQTIVEPDQDSSSEAEPSPPDSESDQPHKAPELPHAATDPVAEPHDDETPGKDSGPPMPSAADEAGPDPSVEAAGKSDLDPAAKLQSDLPSSEEPVSDPDPDLGQSTPTADPPVSEETAASESGLPSSATAPVVETAADPSSMPRPKSPHPHVVGDPPAADSELDGEDGDEIIQRRIAEFEQKLAMQCPLCGEGKIVAKETAKNKIYYQCLNTNCNLISWGKPYHLECPRCKNPFLVETVDAKRRTTLKCPRATCRHRQGLPAVTAGGSPKKDKMVTKTTTRKPRRKVVKRRVVRRKR